MLEYLAQNFGYILVAGVLLLIVAAIILRMVRNRRAGKGGCGHGCAGCAHGCAGCAHAAFCHPEARREPDKSAAGPGARTGGE